MDQYFFQKNLQGPKQNISSLDYVREPKRKQFQIMQEGDLSFILITISFYFLFYTFQVEMI